MELEMQLLHEIPAEYFINLIHCMMSDALEYAGYGEDQFDELTFDMFEEYVQHLANQNEVLQLFGD